MWYARVFTLGGSRYEAIEGLFRHEVHDDAIALTSGHIRDMQRTYGWTIFPEAWSSKGGPWGDQWSVCAPCASLRALVAVDSHPGRMFQICASSSWVVVSSPTAPADAIKALPFTLRNRAQFRLSWLMRPRTGTTGGALWLSISSSSASLVSTTL